MPTQTEIMERIVALCRRRGFIFGSSEIYGGIGGFWDYGPLGCELKRNIKDAWWLDMVRNPPPHPTGVEYQMVGVDCSIIMNPKVWEASGHVGGFSDPMVDCRECKARFRADQLSHFVFRPIEGSTPTDIRQIHRLLDDVRPTAKLIAEDLFSEPAEYEKDIKRSLNARKLEMQIQEIGGFASGGPSTALIITTDSGNRFLSRQYPGIPDENEYRKCPRCRGELTEPRDFNLMFQTYVGALQDSSSIAFLRPETAQGIFANFKNVMDSTRVKIPFGIAQMGKAFRNEINPRNYTFRSREFEQMEIEFFCKPDELCREGEITALEWYEFWRDARIRWYESLGIKSDKLRPRQQDKDELAHYSKACTDIEYLFPFSDEPQELEGVAHRGDFDLKAHGAASKNNDQAFAVVDEDLPNRDRKGAVAGTNGDRQGAGGPGAKKSTVRYVPHVIEPSAGVDRFALAVICEAYSFDESRASPEFMKFHPRLAPIKAAVFPLVAKDGMPEIAEPIYRAIKKQYPCQYDAKQSIGKRYARMDEAGTPFCFTIDGQSKEDGTVTVRNRDDASQIRIDKSRCVEYLQDQLKI